MAIKARIKMIRENKSQRVFANDLCVSNVTIGRWERGERLPDCDDLNRILEAYPEINPTWLLTGEGEMKRGEGDIPEKNGGFPRRATPYTWEGKLQREVAQEESNNETILLNEPLLMLMIQAFFEVFISFPSGVAFKNSELIVNIYYLFANSFTEELPDIEECKRIMKIIIGTTESLQAGNKQINSTDFGELLIKGLNRHQ